MGIDERQGVGPGGRLPLATEGDAVRTDEHQLRQIATAVATHEQVRSQLTNKTMLSLAVSATGAVFAWRHWSGQSALSEPGAIRQYGIILGVEFGVAAAGAAALALLRHSEYFAPWICLVVGVHFFLMAPVLKSPPLFVLGAVLIAVAAAAVLI
jgi:hypothetical protein